MFPDIRLLARYLWASPNTLLGCGRYSILLDPQRAGSILTKVTPIGDLLIGSPRGYCAVTLGHLFS